MEGSRALGKYYSSYIGHCARFYFSHPSPTFATDAQRRDWEAVRAAAGTLSRAEREALVEYYAGGARGAAPAWLWKTLRRFERRAAEERGLI
jgi:hypothetical protein